MKKRSSKIKNAFAKVHFLWFVLLAVGMLIIIWLLPIEEKLNEVNTPNLNAQKYVMSKDYKIAVKDSFLYRINRTNFGVLKAVTVKQTAPISEVNITVKKPTSATLNILNATDYTKIYLNGRLLDTKLYPANIYYGKNLNNERAILSYIRSSEVLNEPKGAYVTLNLKRGENEIKLLTEKNDQELKFNVASDFHSGYTIGLIGLAEMLQDNPDFIILNGDIVDYGNKAEYILISALTELSPIPIYTNIGNHENWQNGKKFYQNYFGPFNKSFVYKNALFVFLDNHTGRISNKQFEWLDGVLRNAQEKHKFVFAHMPAIDAHSKKFDSTKYKYPEMAHNMYHKAESDRLISVLDNNHVDVLFSGHNHIYNQFRVSTFTQANSGTLGGKTSTVDEVAYLKVKVNDKKVFIDKAELANGVGSFNKEHDNRPLLIKTFAKPFIYDKRNSIMLSLLAAITVSGLFVFSRIKIK